MTGNLAQPAVRSYAFGDFRLFPERQLLLRGETPVRIGGRALDILTALVERPGEVVDKHALLSRVWPDTFVEDSNLKVNMAALRRALDERPGATQYVATVIGRGYRFVAPVLFSSSADMSAYVGPPSQDHHNLPTATTRIVGREDAIEALRLDLCDARLVSIVGAGGIGKTTVALAVAEHAVGVPRDGVWLIDLSPLRHPSLVPDAIATAIGMGEHPADMLTALSGFLRKREMLLVLDNCEHLIEAVAACVDRILADAAGVKVLATSREPLGVRGERVRRLPGLGTPPESAGLKAEEALAFPAIQLFVARAADRLESFTLSDADAPVVAEICRRLDGLALAIELAATRIDAFGAEGLLKQLDDRFRLLSGWRSGPERHRTLMATLDWSYSLLPEREAAMLRALSVFAGTFGAESAAAVSNRSPAEVADALAQLVAKSLLTVDVSGDTVTYRLLDTTRAYAIERFGHSEDGDAVRRVHAEHVCLVLERGTSEWAERPAQTWGGIYGRVLDDLRAALAWARSDGMHRSLQIRLTVAGLMLWNHLSLTEECRVHVLQAVEELEAAGLAGTATEMQLMAWLGGSTMFTRGLMPSAIEAMRRALDIAVEIGDVDYRVRCLRLIGVYQLFTGENDAAIGTLETFAALAAAEFPSAVLEAEAALGIGELFIGRFPDLRKRFELRHELDLPDIADAQRVRHHVRYLSDRIVDVTNVLSHVQWLTGSPDTALNMARATVEYAFKTKHHLSLSNALSWACPVFYWTGRYDECARYVGMLDDEARRHGFDVRRPVAMFYRAALAGAQSDSAADEIDGIEHAIVEFHATGHLARLPFYLGVLAEFLVKRGRFGDADNTIRSALDRANAKNERWCLPELLRIQASTLTAMGQAEQAEQCLLEAMEIARNIGALSWRLRAATDLARFWGTRSRADDARRMLSPIFSAFTEGFATADLMAAAGLLASPAKPEVAARR